MSGLSRSLGFAPSLGVGSQGPSGVPARFISFQNLNKQDSFLGNLDMQLLYA
jgi:hypothetical protein